MFLKKEKCSRCEGKLKEEFSFCPYCGFDRRNFEKDMRDYGLLGKNESLESMPLIGGGMGFAENLFQSLFSGLMKSLEQMNSGEGDKMRSDIRMMPNGIIVNLSHNTQQQNKKGKGKTITEEQIKRMSALPRAEGKTDVRRLSDKVVYEVKTPGVSSVEDIFVSKVESGYEVKVIGDKKVYVNTFSLDLPLKGYGLMKDSVMFEFGL